MLRQHRGRHEPRRHITDSHGGPTLVVGGTTSGAAGMRKSIRSARLARCRVASAALPPEPLEPRTLMCGLTNDDFSAMASAQGSPPPGLASRFATPVSNAFAVTATGQRLP